MNLSLTQKIESYMQKQVDFNTEVILRGSKTIQVDIEEQYQDPETQETKTRTVKKDQIIYCDPYIDEWNIQDKPQPTLEQLNVITEPYVVPLTPEQINTQILAQINQIDLKRVRALAEGGTSPVTGKTYLEEYTEEIQALRAGLIKE